MQITLKNIRENKALSEETPCFSASLYVDGTKVADVINRGHGGCNEYRWLDRSIASGVEAEAAKIVEDTFEPLDMLVYRLMDQAEEEKQYKRWCKKCVVFRQPNDPEGQWRTLPSIKWQPALKQKMIDRFGKDVEILNERFD